MPTVITHAIVGSSLGLLTPQKVPTVRLVLILAILPVLPDLDVIGFKLGIPYEHPLGHRGFTHSITFALMMALAVPSLLFRGQKLFSREWLIIAVLCFLATVSHGVLDAFTDAGLGVGFFIPFDNERYFFDWRPLATSPLSIRSFFSERGLQILASEAYWIGIPLALFSALLFVLRRLRKRKA